MEISMVGIVISSVTIGGFLIGYVTGRLTYRNPLKKAEFKEVEMPDTIPDVDKPAKPGQARVTKARQYRSPRTPRL